MTLKKVNELETEEKLVRYFLARKEFEESVRYLGFKTGQLPTLFTEQLCRYLCDLELYEGNGRDYDAILNANGKEEYVEIKTTQTLDGDTTFSSIPTPDWVYWMYISLSDSKIKIFKIPADEINAYVKKTGKDRPSVKLKDYTKDVEVLEFRVTGKAIQQVTSNQEE
ncbi:hypothetical protein GOP80_06865 [Planococcaceae bacterium Storch 2/2-2]|nr:hypothetical protein [Planococcaceae bacterium Storch 2/2-2]